MLCNSVDNTVTIVLLVWNENLLSKHSRPVVGILLCLQYIAYLESLFTPPKVYNILIVPWSYCLFWLALDLHIVT